MDTHGQARAQTPPYNVNMGVGVVSAGSGSIDPDELRIVLKSCLRESAISLPEEKLDDLTLALFESADKDKSGAITFEELKAELESFPEVMENLTIRLNIRDTWGKLKLDFSLQIKKIAGWKKIGN